MDNRGEEIYGDTLLLLFNAVHHAVKFTLPALDEPQPWEQILDTANSDAGTLMLPARTVYPVGSYSLVVFRLVRPELHTRRVEFPAPLVR